MTHREFLFPSLAASPLVKEISHPYFLQWQDWAISTKFHKDWTKNWEFLLMANFWECPVFFPLTLNMKSVGQRESKLLAVKVGGLKKKSAIWPRPLSNQSAWVWLRPGSNLSQSFTDSNFAALSPTDPIFTESIDLNPLKNVPNLKVVPSAFGSFMAA